MYQSGCRERDGQGSNQNRSHLVPINGLVKIKSLQCVYISNACRLLVLLQAPVVQVIVFRPSESDSGPPKVGLHWTRRFLARHPKEKYESSTVPIHIGKTHTMQNHLKIGSVVTKRRYVLQLHSIPARVAPRTTYCPVFKAPRELIGRGYCTHSFTHNF